MQGLERRGEGGQVRAAAFRLPEPRCGHGERPARDKWQLTYKRSGKTGYAWIDPDLHYLVKMQDPAAQTTMQVREVKEGPQEPSLFAGAHGYTKMDPPEPPRPSHP